MRLALIGAGRWGRNYIRTISGLSGVRLSRLASSNPESVRLVSADCEVVRAWQEVLDARFVDGVIIATPPHLHAEMALAAMEAGMPTLLEKPLAMSIDQARALKSKATECGVYSLVDHTHLFHPAYRALKASLPRQGAILEIRCEAGAFGPFRPDVPVLWDWGAHDVAMCLDLLGAVPRVSSATVQKTHTNSGQGETVRLELSFPHGVEASIRLCNVMEKTRKLSVRCASGTSVYDGVGSDPLVVTPADGSPATSVRVSGAAPLTVAVTEFVSGIRNRSTDCSSLDLGVKVVEVLQACTDAISPEPT